MVDLELHERGLVDGEPTLTKTPRQARSKPQHTFQTLAMLRLDHFEAMFVENDIPT